MANDKVENVKTPRALGCYVFLQKPRAGQNGGDLKYGVTLLWEKKADLSKLKAAIEQVAVEKFGPTPSWRWRRTS
jgi:hypothetical protein